MDHSKISEYGYLVVRGKQTPTVLQSIPVVVASFFSIGSCCLIVFIVVVVELLLLTLRASCPVTDLILGGLLAVDVHSSILLSVLLSVLLLAIHLVSEKGQHVLWYYVAAIVVPHRIHCIP
jgi:hypothetical protein